MAQARIARSVGERLVIRFGAPGLENPYEGAHGSID
jgi:hypothetical protein